MLDTLQKRLENKAKESAVTLNFDKEKDLLHAFVEETNELPVFLSETDSEVICIAYLFKAEEIVPGKSAELHQKMLELNIGLPLSSFAKINDSYAIVGSLAKESAEDLIVEEILITQKNATNALQAFEDYYV